MEKKLNIKKGKITMTITIGIACFALVAIMFMQFKLVNQTDIALIESMRETELREQLANWKSKYEETDAQYNELQSKIKEYNETKESNEETETLVDQELAIVNMNLGKTDVQGEGIEVTLRKAANTDMPQINADDLLVIVNSLKLAGAEAISINDQRVVNMTDIVNINANTDDMFVKVNGQRILTPYIIKAIGNQAYLEVGLTGNGGYVDKLKKIGHDVSIKRESKMTIGKYNGDIKTKYME